MECNLHHLNHKLSHIKLKFQKKSAVTLSGLKYGFIVFLMSFSTITSATIFRFGGQFDFIGNGEIIDEQKRERFENGYNELGIVVNSSYFVGELSYGGLLEGNQEADLSSYELINMRAAVGPSEQEAARLFSLFSGDPDFRQRGMMQAGSWSSDRVEIINNGYYGSSPVLRDSFLANANKEGELYEVRISEGTSLQMGIDLTDYGEAELINGLINYDGRPEAFYNTAAKDYIDLRNALPEFDVNMFGFQYNSISEGYDTSTFAAGRIDWITVPEPSTLALMAMGLIGVVRRKTRRTY